MALLRSIATVGSYTAASRVLGFIRDILTAAVLGAGPVADAFFVAFRLPNFFRALFAEGAFSAAFVPMFSGTLAAEGRERAIAFAQQALGVLLFTLLGVVVAVEIATPWLMFAIAPGFADEPDKLALSIEFTRVTFPYLLFVAVVALQGGVLNSLNRFAAMAACPILLNLCMITAILSYRPLSEAGLAATAGHTLSWGVAAAGVAQFVWMVIACHRAGVSLHVHRPRLTKEVRTLLRRMLPGVMGAGVVQVNLVVSTIIASFLPTGAVSYLYYADRVNQLPLGVVGIAVGTALLPLLSRQVREGARSAALYSQNRALEFALLLTVPAAAALIAIGGPIITVLFERGNFGPQEAAATVPTLAAFSVGLPAYVLVKVLAPGFFARGDTATPVRIAIVAMVTNLVLNLALMVPLQHVGIALGTALASWVNCGLLGFFLVRRGLIEFDARLKQRVRGIVLSALGMALGLVGLSRLLESWLSGPPVHRVSALAALVLTGLLLFAVLAHVLGATRLQDLKKAFRPGAAEGA
ncbi:MAG: murein biosynthesis integral membrane protein MurJ [Alphaproteobacteria bacterium]